MNCYLCLVEQKIGNQSAYALCQRCGAAICEQHMVEVVFPPVVGPGGTSTPILRYKLVCCRCYNAEHSPPTMPREYTPRPRAFSFRQWWRRLWGHPSPLPTPTEAVKMVEQFLEKERSS